MPVTKEAKEVFHKKLHCKLFYFFAVEDNKQRNQDSVAEDDGAGRTMWPKAFDAFKGNVNESHKSWS
jgi:hypothetical protein